MNERLLKILGGEMKFYPALLESTYPRIFNKIMLFWDTPDITDYFNQLMVTDREDRAGFPPEIAAEIMRLSLVHASQHAPLKKDDVWEVATDKFASYKPQASIHISEDWKPLPPSTKRAIENFGIPCSAKGFHQAVETGNRPVTALFLSARVNTEISNDLGWTPLMLAATKGHTMIISQLIQHRANVRARDLAGNTALHWAVEGSQASSVKLLLENYAEVDALNNDGLSPLLQATLRRNFEIVLMLIDKGANLNLITKNGATALHTAAASGYSEIVRALLHDAADTRIKNRDGETPLMLAEKFNHLQVIKLLSPKAKTE
jgi:ankyrin repeat protein